MAFIVTGTPGTGKTEIAKEIAKKMNLKYINANSVIKEKKLIEYYDKEKQTNVVDEKKLVQELLKIIKKNNKVIIDTHLSHEIPPKKINLCIVTKCELKELKKRLKKRGYKENKIQENLDAEIFDICLNEAKEKGHKILLIDTTNKTAKEIINNLLI
ncbi:MAG: AAA family ATPase [Nanoarchaeota archaeon]|nr:AAA family ATPase [Nanoarchaeota archaeon]